MRTSWRCLMRRSDATSSVAMSPRNTADIFPISRIGEPQTGQSPFSASACVKLRRQGSHQRYVFALVDSLISKLYSTPSGSEEPVASRPPALHRRIVIGEVY